MAKDRFAVNPFPDIKVTEEQEQELIELVRGYIEGYFHKYEDFVVDDKRKVDGQRWKHVKSRDNVHVYTERNGQRITSKASKSPEDLPVMLGTGTIVGALDDLMLGVVNPTLDAMRIKASYVHDLDSAAVLHRVVEPSAEEPFQSLIIKWMTIDLPLQSTSLVKRRDFVYIEATGILKFMNGEQVGYHLLHSVEFPETKPLPNTIRSNYSVFGFFRQIERNVIDLYAGGTVDPGGELMRLLVLPTAAEAFLSVTNCVYCGQMKKLSWMLQRRQSSFQRHSQFMNQATCSTCTKPTSGARGFRSSTCKLCYGCVCRRCKVPKRISFIAVDGRLIQRKITFCTQCINEYAKSDAQKAARDQAMGYEAYNAFQTSSDSSEATFDE